MVGSWLITMVVVACVGEGPSDLAGKYTLSFPWSESRSLTLSSNGRFAYDGFGCLHIVGLPEGTYAVKAGHLVLHPERGDADRRTPTDFVLIRWGDRLYLIPSGEEHAKEFCNSVNLGEEARRRGKSGPHFLRDWDWMKGVTGLPDVPAAWSRFLLKKPLTGEVIGVRNGGQATVNLGPKDGIWEGMKLCIGEQESSLAKVVDVQEDFCIVGPEYDALPIAFAKGQKVSSRLPSSERDSRPTRAARTASSSK